MGTDFECLHTTILSPTSPELATSMQMFSADYDYLRHPLTFLYLVRQLSSWTNFKDPWWPPRSSVGMIVTLGCHQWGTCFCKTPSMSSSVPSVIRMMKRVCKMVAFYGESEWSLPRQGKHQWWGSYTKGIYAEWRASHAQSYGGQELMQTEKEWWKTAMGVRSTASHLPLHPFIHGKGSQTFGLHPHWFCWTFSIARQALLNLAVVNEHFKWLELLAVLNLTSQTTIDTLCTIFAAHGLPELLASFSSTEFKELMEQKWNLPYHITRVLPSFQWLGWVSCADIDVQWWAQECKWWGSTNTPSGVPFTLESPHLDLNEILLMRCEGDNVNSYMFPISQVEQSGYLEYLYSQVKFLRVFGSPSTPLYIVSIKFKAVGSGAAGASRTTSFQGADFFTIYFLV